MTAVKMVSPAQQSLRGSNSPSRRPIHDVSPELAALDGMDLDALRRRWLDLTGRDAPVAFRGALLRQALAYEIQVARLGGLSGPLKRRLRLLAEAAREDRFDEVLGTPMLKPGTVLIRNWQGQNHRVTVLEKGFLWNGATYRTLSAIAKTITGTSWNGWTFFGTSRPVGRNRNGAKQKPEPAVAIANG